MPRQVPTTEMLSLVTIENQDQGPHYCCKTTRDYYFTHLPGRGPRALNFWLVVGLKRKPSLVFDQWFRD